MLYQTLFDDLSRDDKKALKIKHINLLAALIMTIFAASFCQDKKNIKNQQYYEQKQFNELGGFVLRGTFRNRA